MTNTLKALGYLLMGQLRVCAYGAGMLVISWILFRHG